MIHVLSGELFKANNWSVTTDTINKAVIAQSTCRKVQLLSKPTVFENLEHYTENSHNPLFDVCIKSHSPLALRNKCSLGIN